MKLITNLTILVIFSLISISTFAITSSSTLITQQRLTPKEQHYLVNSQAPQGFPQNPTYSNNGGANRQIVCNSNQTLMGVTQTGYREGASDPPNVGRPRVAQTQGNILYIPICEDSKAWGTKGCQKQSWIKEMQSLDIMYITCAENRYAWRTVPGY